MLSISALCKLPNSSKWLVHDRAPNGIRILVSIKIVFIVFSGILVNLFLSLDSRLQIKQK
jgi:hypothetical protein